MDNGKKGRSSYQLPCYKGPEILLDRSFAFWLLIAHMFSLNHRLNYLKKEENWNYRINSSPCSFYSLLTRWRINTKIKVRLGQGYVCVSVAG
jgi:hypothetical protein